jgi:predicted ribosome quality control (RQC) complex YloA/Tae2 family protein
LKTEMTSFDIAALVYELNHTIKGARIENVYQINQATLLLLLHKPNQPTLQLLIESGKQVRLTGYVVKKPAQPPAFCMELRKHLNNGRVEDLQQYEFERIITFKISTGEDMFQLIVEVFGEGNIILVNSQGIIITARTYKRMRDRSILRNEAFQHAPASGENPFYINRNEMEELKNFGQLEIVRALTKFFGIGGLYAEEVLLRAGVDKNTHCQTLTGQQLDAVFKNLQTVLSALREARFDPAIIVNEKGEWIDVTPICLKKYEELKRLSYKTFNEALDEYYTQTTKQGEISEVQKQYERELAKQHRMLEDQQRTLEDSRRAVEQNKRFGDLIYSRVGELQLLLQEISEDKQRGESWDQIIHKLKERKQAQSTPAIYFDSLDVKHMILNISIEGNTFPISMNRSIQANAAEYYERMKKAERKLEGSEKALRETRQRIEELQKVWIKKIEETRGEETPKREKKAWYEKFRWFISSDGFLAVGGRDATTNEILIKKHLDPEDIVFHAEIVGAPFVVVKSQGKAPTEQAIREAAQFAASYSRGWREMLGSIDVYWVYPSQVSKTAPSKQYLEKGSFIIQGTRNYVRKTPLRIAIGVQEKDAQLQVIGGPTEAVHRETNLYVDVVPGDETSSRLARQIRRLLTQKAAGELREKILRIPVEQIQQFIPLGKGAISA